jgi:hypothetical protein
MSDGPHRSLPLRTGWQKVAEAADNQAAGADEIAERIPAALKQDWNQEVPGRLVREIAKILTENQGTLFASDRMEKLEVLRPAAAGSPLGGTLLDHAIEIAVSGRTGIEAVTETIQSALMDRAANSSRAVEEHYHREATRERSDNVRGRIEDGVRQAPIRDLARDLSGETDAPSVAAPKKRSGLDDGVEL